MRESSVIIRIHTEKYIECFYKTNSERISDIAAWYNMWANNWCDFESISTYWF